MSKSIADRLAGDVRSLENNIVCQSARIKELREENARLDEDNREAWRRLGNWKSLANCVCDSAGALEEERDDAIRRAESAEARVEELTTENARLEQEVAEVPEDYKVAAGRTKRLEDSVRWLRGQLRTGDHNIARQKDRICELAEERDNLRVENERLTEVLDRRHTEREELQAENKRLAQEAQFAEMRKSPAEQEIKILRAENERLRRYEPPSESVRQRLDAWGEVIHHPFLSPCFEKEGSLLSNLLAKLDAAYARAAVPRVIHPDEVRKGQVVAMCFDTVTNGPEWYLDEPGYPASIDSVVTAADTIVLLEDSPEDTGEEAA